MKPSHFLHLQFILIAALLTACGVQATATLELPTIEPSATPAAPLLLLVAPPQADPPLVAAVAQIAGDYAGQHQLRFEQRQLLDPAQLPAGLTKLLLIAPDPGAAALAAAAPQIPIITIGFSPESQLPNVTSLVLATQARETAFMAGYVAALTAYDWRAGVLYTPSSASLADDFMAGAEYFCGACTSVTPPEADFPLAAQAADPTTWQAAADLLLASQTRVVYLSPELEASEAGQYLANFGVLLIGGSAPPADLAASWLVSVSADPIAILQAQLPLALDGAPLTGTSSLALSNANPLLLSEARLAYIQAVIDDLAAGFISLPSEQ